MNVLIIGANGFIAREIMIRLAASGHTVSACVHSTLLENIPHAHVFQADFTKITDAQYWLPHLKNIDAVINCVGVFQTAQEKTMWTIHYDAPKALFDACVTQGVKTIIQFSALGVDKVNVPYAASKLALERYIQNLNINSVIIRPGLVYGKGAYGGSAFFRGLASIPFIIPLPRDAQKLQQPVHLDDVTLIVEKALTLSGKHIVCAVGDEKLSVKTILIKLRSWLGFKKARLIFIPSLFIRLGSLIGNYIHNSPLSDTAMKMMTVDNTASSAEMNTLETTLSFKPRGFSDGLSGMVSSVQDRWHARLYFLRPLLRLSIAFIWLFSGIVSLLPASAAWSTSVMTHAHIPLTLQPFTLYLLSIMDILLGLATLLNYRLVLTGILQCIGIVLYTILISILMPHYWLDPFTAIAKNIPLLVTTLIMMTLASER